MSITAGRSVVVGALAIGALSLAPGAQAKPVRPPLEILSPQRGAVLVAPTAGHVLKVRLRVGAGVRKVRVVVSGRGERVVTRRLKRGRGGVWTATLRPGRELSRGPGAVRVSGRRAGRAVATSAHFWVASRRAELLRVSGLPGRTRPRPLDVRLRTAKRVHDVRVRVNGRDARAHFTRTAGGSWSASLSPSAGLRFGRNRVTVTAYTRTGDFERVTRVVRVRRGQPFAAAGADRRARQRELVRLDGRATLPHSAQRMRFSWRIVRRPKGSRARLRNPGAVRPHLRPDRPGRYDVRLVVRPTRSRARASAAAVEGTDTVTVAATPAVRPRGVLVQTIAVDGQSRAGVKVGRDFYAMGAGAFQLVVLDGSTLELQRNATYPASDAGAETLMWAVQSVGDRSIAIITQPQDRPASLTDQGETWLANALDAIRFQPDASQARAFDRAPAPGWSFIGSPGSATGRGLLSFKQAPDRPAGAMTGYLQSIAGAGPGDAGGLFVFNWPATFTQFDTHAGGDGATFNEMTLAGKAYRSDTIAAGASAFHLVWLDGGTLDPLGQATLPGDDPRRLAQTLQSVADANPAMLFMTTIGHPRVTTVAGGTDNGWAAAANLVAQFGGNPNAFLALDGSDRAAYSLAGASLTGAAAPNAGADISLNLQSAPAARVVGMLERRTLGAWDVEVGGAPRGAANLAALTPGIRRVLAQADQAFLAFDGPGEPEAEAYIARQLRLDLDPVDGIRANYWRQGLSAQWANFKNAIADPGLVPPCTDAPCSQGFRTVQRQLDVEFDAVARVRTYFGSDASGTLYQAFNNQFIASEYDFDHIADKIISKYPPQEETASGPNRFDLVEGMLDVGAELVPEGGEALGVAGAALKIAGAFTEGEESTGYLGATEFEAAASQFASTLEHDYTNTLDGLDRIADLLVSDAGRLQAAADAVVGDWAVSGANLSAVLDRSMAAYMWTSLLPATFTAYQCVVPPVYYPREPTTFRPAPWYEVTIDTPANLRWPLATVTNWWPRTPGGWGISGNPVAQVNNVGLLTVGAEIAGDFQYLDNDAARDLFGALDPADKDKLGLSPHYLLALAPRDGAPGFRVDRGAYDASTYDDHGYVRFLCATNEWREDTNVRGQSQPPDDD